MTTSLIDPENTWALWAILTGWAALCIFLEQKYRWAAKISGCVLALLGMMLLSNLAVIPAESPVYESVWNYVVPMAIPLLLFPCNIKKIGKESGRLFLIFLLSSFGTMIGSLLGFFLLHKRIPELGKIAAMFTATYVGGSVNFAAMADSFAVPGSVVSAAVVADNLLMALYFFVLLAIPGIRFFRKHFPHPMIDEQEADGKGEAVGEYWKSQAVSLQDIAFAFAATVAIVAVSTGIADWFCSILPESHVLYLLLGNKYLIMTSLTMSLATLFPKLFGEAAGASEIGTFLIYIFFAVIGAPASIVKILTESPLFLLYAMIIVLTNMIFSLGMGKLFHFSLEEIILASNANIGGPTTAAAMAISKGWKKLVGPVMLIGTLGYILGNYYGILVGGFLVN